MVSAHVLWQIGRLLSLRHHTGHTYFPQQHCGDALLWQGRSVVYKSETSGGQLSGQRPIEGLPGAGMCEVLRDLCSIVLFGTTMLCNCAQFHYSASFTHTQSFSHTLNMSDMVLQFCHSCTWHSPFWPPRVQSIVCHLLIIIFNSFRLDIHKFSWIAFLNSVLMWLLLIMNILNSRFLIELILSPPRLPDELLLKI